MDPKLFWTRYRPYIAIIGAVVALVWFLPGGADDSEQASAGGSLVTTPGANTPGGATPIDSGQGTAVTTPDGKPVSGSTKPGAAAPGGQTGTANQAVAVPEGAGADCDTSTGRIKVPTIAAPPCVPPFSGDNGGSTYQGVTADTIKVVYFQAESDPA